MLSFTVLPLLEVTFLGKMSFFTESKYSLVHLLRAPDKRGY